MITVAVRELRNNTAGVVQKVREGQTVVLTSHGERIGRILPVNHRRPYLSPAEVLDIPQADAGLRQDLIDLGLDDTDGLGPIQ